MSRVDLDRIIKVSLKTAKLMVKLMFECGKKKINYAQNNPLRQASCFNWTCACAPHWCIIGYQRLVANTRRHIGRILVNELSNIEPWGVEKTVKFTSTHPRLGATGFNPLFFALKDLGLSNAYIDECLEGLLFSANITSSLHGVTFHCGSTFYVDFPVCRCECTCCA